jgi:hypothetical protein
MKDEQQQQQQQQHIQKSISSSGGIVDSSAMARASPASNNLVGIIGPQQQGIHLLVPTDKDVLGGRGKVVQNHGKCCVFRKSGRINESCCFVDGHWPQQQRMKIETLPQNHRLRLF